MKPSIYSQFKRDIYRNLLMCYHYVFKINPNVHQCHYCRMYRVEHHISLSEDMFYN